MAIQRILPWVMITKICDYQLIWGDLTLFNNQQQHTGNSIQVFPRSRSKSINVYSKSIQVFSKSIQPQHTVIRRGVGAWSSKLPTEDCQLPTELNLLKVLDF